MELKNKEQQICSGIPEAEDIYREKKFLDGIRKEQKGLEIGPSHSPVVPKKEGYHVETVDWLDQAGLIKACCSG